MIGSNCVYSNCASVCVCIWGMIDVGVGERANVCVCVSVTSQCPLRQLGVLLRV